ncbi:MAG: hypothetical protein V7605_1624, partial [Acidimicrobiaceae bacterium]
AGTGMERYRNLDIQAPDYEPLSYYSSDTDTDLAAWLANIGTTTGGPGDTGPMPLPEGVAPPAADGGDGDQAESAYLVASPEDAAS